MKNVTIDFNARLGMKIIHKGETLNKTIETIKAGLAAFFKFFCYS